MSTVVLSAASAGLPGLQALSIVLEDELRRAGKAEIRTFDLATMRLAYCQGEFDCWTRTPGERVVGTAARSGPDASPATQAAQLRLDGRELAAGGRATRCRGAAGHGTGPGWWQRRSHPAVSADRPSACGA
jgi:hypothetical protein